MLLDLLLRPCHRTQHHACPGIALPHRSLLTDTLNALAAMGPGRSSSSVGYRLTLLNPQLAQSRPAPQQLQGLRGFLEATRWRKVLILSSSCSPSAAQAT